MRRCRVASEQPGGRELVARRERLLVVVDVQAQEVVLDAGAEHNAHLAFAQCPLARAEAAQARVTAALGKLRRAPASGAPLQACALGLVEDLKAVVLEIGGRDR